MKVRELMEEVRDLSVWSPYTTRTYKSCVDLICAEFEHGDPDLDDISTHWLTQYRARCLRSLSPVTFNSRRRHLSRLWKHAVDRKYIKENVIRLVGPAPVPRKPKAIPRDDLAKYLEVLDSTKRVLPNGTAVDMFAPKFFWIGVVKTFYSTGMRLRQLVGLQWRDIDWNARSIQLRAETSKTKREWEIPISDSLLPVLEDLRRRTIDLVGNDIGRRQVFCLPLFSDRRASFKHKEMTADRVMKFFLKFRSFQDDSSVRMTAHNIRHTTATQLLRGVANIKVVQELLGHTTSHTTLQYVHPDLDDLRSAVNLL